MQTDLPCFYSNLPGTRARRLCFGRTTSFSGRRSRECGFVDDVALCLEHYRIAKGTSNKCCVLFDSARCRGSLRACPERLFAVLDDIVGQPAAFLCRSHLETIDSMEQVTAHPLYRPPAKRSAIESYSGSIICADYKVCLYRIYLKPKNRGQEPMQRESEVIFTRIYMYI